MRVGVLAVAGLMVVGASGCGGGGGEPLTKAEFVTRANAVCSASESRIRDGGKDILVDTGKVPTSEQLNSFASKVVVPEMQRQIDQIGDFRPPKDDQRRVDEILGAARDGRDKVKSFAAVLHQDPFKRYGELADAYGLEACGKIDNAISDLVSGESK